MATTVKCHIDLDGTHSIDLDGVSGICSFGGLSGPMTMDLIKIQQIDSCTKPEYVGSIAPRHAALCLLALIVCLPRVPECERAGCGV